MKRLPIFFLFLLAMMGCHRDRNGVLYSEYPIIDRAYRTYADSLGNYTVFWFESNGSCKKKSVAFWKYTQYRKQLLLLDGKGHFRY